MGIATYREVVEHETVVSAKGLERTRGSWKNAYDKIKVLGYKKGTSLFRDRQ